MPDSTIPSIAEPIFAEGQRVELLVATIGLADDADLEVVIPPGTVGVVTCVRECGNQDGPQGPWLYDVEFPVEADGKPDMCWGIYDASDAHQLRAVAAEGR